jgi:hypothetical protein
MSTDLVAVAPDQVENVYGQPSNNIPPQQPRHERTGPRPDEGIVDSYPHVGLQEYSASSHITGPAGIHTIFTGTGFTVNHVGGDQINASNTVINSAPGRYEEADNREPSHHLRIAKPWLNDSKEPSVRLQKSVGVSTVFDVLLTNFFYM